MLCCRARGPLSAFLQVSSQGLLHHATASQLLMQASMSLAAVTVSNAKAALRCAGCEVEI